MLLTVAVLERIKAGKITLVFRRWARPTVKGGGRLRTAVGELRITGIRIVREKDITTADAAAAGFDSRAALLRSVARGQGVLYRIGVAYDGADRRVALREADDLAATEMTALLNRLARMDQRSADGPWTRQVLEIIAGHPRVVSRELASLLGCDRDRLKPNVRKLKNLGLTVSHEIGYTLSPRGRAVLTRLQHPPTASPGPS